MSFQQNINSGEIFWILEYLIQQKRTDWNITSWIKNYPRKSATVLS